MKNLKNTLQILLKDHCHKGVSMSYVSTAAKLNMAAQKLGHKCQSHVAHRIDRSYSNFAGSNVPPMTKESLKKALPDKYKTMRAW